MIRGKRSTLSKISNYLTKLSWMIKACSYMKMILHKSSKKIKLDLLFAKTMKKHKISEDASLPARLLS